MKRLRKRILAFFLAFGLVVTGPMAPLQMDAYAASEQESAIPSEAPTATLAVSEAKIYVDGSMTDYTGHDGSSAALALQDLKAAVAALGTTGGTVVVTGPLSYGAKQDDALPEHTEMIVITSFDGTTDYRSAENGGAVLNLDHDLALGGPTTFKDITFNARGRANTANKRLYLAGNGKELVIDTGVECVAESGYSLSIAGGKRATNLANGVNTSVTVKSGTWHNVYGGGYAARVFGNTSVLITGGTFLETVTGGSYNSRVTGNTTLIFDAAEADDISVATGTTSGRGIYGSTISGWTIGDAHLIIRGKTVMNSTQIYGGGYSASYGTDGTVYVDVSEDAVLNGRLYGGGCNSHVSDVVMTVRGNAQLADGSYLGAYNAEVGKLSATFSDNAKVNGNFYGGNRMGGTVESIDIVLEDNAVITSSLRGGGNICTISGDVTVELRDESKVEGVFNGAGQQSTTKGTTTVVLDGGTVGDVFCGGNTSASNGVLNSGTAQGPVKIYLKSGALLGEIRDTGISHADGQQFFVDLSGGGSLELLSGISAKTLIGGGALTLASGTTLAVSDSVTGTVDLTVSGTPSNGTYISAPAGTSESAVRYTSSEYGETMTYSTDAAGAKWEIADSFNNAVRVYFNAPSGVQVKVYDTYQEDETMLLEADDDGSYLLSENKTYMTVASGKGHYTVKKIFVLSDEKKLEAYKNTGGIINVDADPGEVTGEGFYQPNPARLRGTVSGVDSSLLQTSRYANVVLTSDEMRDIAYTVEELEGYPEGGYQTPAFTTEKGKHEYSSNEDIINFIEQLDAADSEDILHHYILGYSGLYKFPIHLAVFSKTAGVTDSDTLEQAAAKVVADSDAHKKPIIFVGAQTHGGEHSSGEGAMAYMAELMKDSYGGEVLDYMNVVVLPRINPDSAYLNTYDPPELGLGLNSDTLMLQTTENRVNVQVDNLFMPHLQLDLHEFQCNSTGSAGIYSADVAIDSGSIMGSEKLIEFNHAHRDAAIKRINTGSAENPTGLWCVPFDPQLAPTTRTVLPAAKGTIGYLVEVRGNGIGRDYYERRVHSHVTAIKAIVPQDAADAVGFYDTITEWRNDRIKQGAIYDDNDPIILNAAKSGTKSYVYPHRRFVAHDGSTTKIADHTTTHYDTVTHSRIRPTAYVIEADVVEAAGPSKTAHTSIKEILDGHAIEYYKLPAGTTVEGLRQLYAKTMNVEVPIDEADLRDAADVTFEKGAYFIPMDQLHSTVIAYLMEQDVIPNEAFSGEVMRYSTLYVQGYVALDSNNNLPIYHYTQDNPRELLKQLEQNDGPAVVEYNGNSYSSLAAALSMTGVYGGGTVTLLEDVSESALTLMTGVTLDLNGNELTTDGVVCFGGYVVDSSADKSGKITCMQGMLMLDAANPDLAVWNGTDGYFFTEIEQVLTQEDTSVAGKYKLTFLPRFTQFAKVAPLLADNGGKDHGVEIKVKLLWDGGEKVLTYSDDMIKTVYGGNAFTVTLTGYESFIALGLKLQVVVEGNGVTAASAPITVS